MKFNEYLYELTKNIEDDDFEYTDEEVEFARVILDEFCNKAKNAKPHDGLISVEFKSRWYSDSDKGYKEINHLSRKFNSMFRHYNIYIGDVSYLEDDFHDAYFKLIWDYRSYMDNLKTREMQSMIEGYEKEKTRKLCESEGHDFSDWFYVRPQEEDHSPIPCFDDDDVESNPYWKRECKRCGLRQITYRDPIEYTKEIEDCESEIERLQNRLRLLKGKKTHI